MLKYFVIYVIMQLLIVQYPEIGYYYQIIEYKVASKTISASRAHLK